MFIDIKYRRLIEALRRAPALERITEKQWNRIPKVCIQEPYTCMSTQVFLVHSKRSNLSKFFTVEQRVTRGFGYILVAIDLADLHEKIDAYFSKDSAVVYAVERLDVLPFTNAPLF